MTTFERGGSVFFLVLNASPASYPKLKDEYAGFVKSLAPKGAAPKSPAGDAPKPPAGAAPRP